MNLLLEQTFKIQNLNRGQSYRHAVNKKSAERNTWKLKSLEDQDNIAMKQILLETNIKFFLNCGWN